jgi:hypothetical protein
MALNFSSYPGAFERQLQRQYKNPLFASNEAEIDELRLEEAQFKDQKELEAFQERFTDLVEKLSELKPNEGSEVMLDLKSRLDQCYGHCCALAGQHEDEKQAIIKLTDMIMTAIRNAAGGDDEAMMNLNEEELARQTHYQLLQSPLVADLLSAQSPIAEEQLVPTLLSESEQALEAAFYLFDEQQQTEILQQSQALLNQKMKQDYTLPEAWKRLEQMKQLSTA